MRETPKLCVCLPYLILSHGNDVNGVEILQQSDDISDHYLVLCKLHIVKAVNSTPSYKYGRTITSTTKNCFVSNLPDLSQFLSISNSSEQLDDVTETMNSLFSSTLDTVAPLRLRKIKEKSPTPWYNEHTRTLKRAARKMERSWRKTKLEVFRIAWRESTLSYRKALKTARSDYFSSLLEQNKHNPRYLFNTVAKLTKNKASTGVDISQQHSSNDFMNYFTSKFDTIRDQIVTKFWVWLCLVYSLLPGVSCLSVLPCLALMSSLNIIIWVYILVCVFLFLLRVCTVTVCPHM